MRGFIKLMDELLRAYADITIQAYMLSTDILESFFCKITPSQKKRTRPAPQILQLITRLVESQMEFWGNGRITTDDYHAINVLNYTMEDPAAEEFLPYGLEGVAFDNVAAGVIAKNEEDYIWLLMDYGIAQYIREQLRCEACLNDLSKRIADENDLKDIVITAYEYLAPEFGKAQVYEAFYSACDIYKTVLQDHMMAKNIGKRLQAITIERVALFRKAGSCNNGVTHQTNLLVFVIYLYDLLI
uniref:Uncharacterized protein n=1 Tax=Glossina morsitans morsitans TaxID=37546 RepID=A0ABK9NGG0_GLOMM